MSEEHDVAVLSVLPSWWESFNSEDNPWPFVLPLIVFGSALVYCYAFYRHERKAFMKWNTLHNFHNVTAIVLACASLYFDNDAILNERVAILFSLAYFWVDLPDCIFQNDMEYLVHAVLCIVCGTANYYRPVHRQLRLNSKAVLCELSSPFLHLAKKTRKPLHQALFLVMFTCCRILWIPFIIKDLYRHQGNVWFSSWSEDYVMLALLAFYALNLFWYYKIILIAIKAIKGSGDENENKTKAGDASNSKEKNATTATMNGAHTKKD